MCRRPLLAERRWVRNVGRVVGLQYGGGKCWVAGGGDGVISDRWEWPEYTMVPLKLGCLYLLTW